MVSERKLAANRANAKKSTGPRTDEGKRRAAMNAVRHGLCAKTVCVHGEESADFNALVAEFAREHRPASSTEYALVYRLAVASWNLRRLTEAETSVIDTATFNRVYEGGKYVEKRLGIGEAMLKAMTNDRRFNALQLYQQRLERAFYRALTELRQLRKDRADRPDDDEADAQVAAVLSDRGLGEPLPAPDAPPTPEPTPATQAAASIEPASQPSPAGGPKVSTASGGDATDPDEPESDVDDVRIEQTNPMPSPQVEVKADVALDRGPANEPTARHPDGRRMSEIDMLASNMRNLRRGLPVPYPHLLCVSSQRHVL